MVAILAAPGVARADDTDLDGRLEGYKEKVALDKSTPVLSWVLFILLAVVGVGALSKNANRSHLD